MNPHSISVSAFAFALLFLCACNPTPDNEKVIVRIGLTSEPDALNPITYKTIDAQVINGLLFQKLMDVDYASLELTPVLAEHQPTIESVDDSMYRLSYTIRPEAKWNDGRSITAEDVLFSHKLGILPGISNEGKKSFLNGIRNVITDPGNPKTVVFECTPNMRMTYATSAELGILPRHHYDPDSVIAQISYTDLANGNLDSTDHASIQNWATEFNSTKFQRDPDGIHGSGPYQLKNWITDQHIELERKPDFWANDISDDHEYFNQIPEAISYFLLKEPAAMIGAARNGQIDAGVIARSADYIALKKDSAFSKNFDLHLAPELTTNLIILNACDPKLADVKTRRALAHLFNAPEYIENVQKSTGERTTGPLHPTKASYRDDLTPYDYDVQRASELLEEAGWNDSDGDGILDKKMGGQKVDLSLEYKYNTGHEGRKNAGLLFKEWARPAGVEINLVNEEWLVFIESLMGNEFEMAFFSWTDEHAPTDPTTIYHSNSIDNGYNFGCFSHAAADSLMEAMTVTVDEKERIEQWHILQEIMHEEVPNIFLSTNSARFFISKKYAPVNPSALTPGYWAGSIRTEP